MPLDARPFRNSVLRGMGTLAPSLLTVVLFAWVLGTLYDYVLRPVMSCAQSAMVWGLADIRAEHEVESPQPGGTAAWRGGVPYRRLDDGSFIPREVYDLVRSDPGAEPLAQTGLGYYRRYVEATQLKPYIVFPVFLLGFIFFLYVLGKFMAAGIGRIVYEWLEEGILRLPLVRNVYSAVKQVIDFLLGQRELSFQRVVAVQYPREGLWTVGYVMGEAFRDLRALAHEPVYSVLMDTSPVPVTGMVAIVRQSDLLDLNITVEEAFEFVISCGVVVPARKSPKRQKP